MSVFSHIGYGGSRVLSSLFALNLDASPLMIGVVVSLYALLPMCLAVYAGQLVDRLGMRLPLAFGALMIVIGLTIPWVRPSIGAICVSASILGVGFMAWQVAAQTMTGSLSGPENRASNFAFLGMGFSLSGLLGPLVAGFSIDLIGYRPTYLVLAALPLVALIGVWWFPGWIPQRRSSPKRGPRPSSFDLWRIPALKRTFFAGGVIATAWDLFNFFLPVYARSIGHSASAIGMIMATFACATFVVRLVAARLAKRHGEPPVLVGAIFVTAVGYALFPFFQSAWALAAIAFLLGLGCGCAQPISMTLIYNLSPKGRAGEGTGIRVMINQLTHVTIPLAFGAVASAAGYVPVFIGCALMLFGGGEFYRRSSARAPLAVPVRPPINPP
ncbi:MAG: MFS transporter [Proteobacteria bacterium]|nr:MFS transporter [Burkholderiales bacterium]